MSPGDRMSKGLDFMLKDIGPKDKMKEIKGEAAEPTVTTRESDIERKEAGVKSQDTSIMSQESGVTTPDSGNIFPEGEDQDVESLESSVMSQESANVTHETEAQPHKIKSRSQEKKKSRNRTQEAGDVSEDIIDQAVTQALQSPKISLYSPLLLAVLKSQQLMLLSRKEVTVLEYRKATKARELVENALKESYPDLCEKILRRMNDGISKS